MMVSRITSCSACSPSTKNKINSSLKANQTDRVAFKGTASRTLTPQVQHSVDILLGRMLGGAFRVNVPISGQQHACEARIGSMGGMNLYLDLDERTRYAIELVDEFKVSPSAQISVQDLQIGNFRGTEVPLEDQTAYDSAVRTVRTLLAKLSRKGKSQTWQFASQSAS
jgi:hypothetical protein